MNYTKPLANLIDCFEKFPSIVPKSAQRMALYLLKMPFGEVERFSKLMIEAKEKIKYCSVCFNMSESNPCEICSNEKRDKKTICVVAETKDLMAIEKTGEYSGVYHVLSGVISPMEGVGVNDLRIKELVSRVANSEIDEIILALNPTVEGEATSLYLNKILKQFNVKITRIAQGLPIGSDLEYADDITISKAIEGRVEI